jgi:hypothetical protein
MSPLEVSRCQPPTRFTRLICAARRPSSASSSRLWVTQAIYGTPEPDMQQRTIESLSEEIRRLQHQITRLKQEWREARSDNHRLRRPQLNSEHKLKTGAWRRQGSRRIFNNPNMHTLWGASAPKTAPGGSVASAPTSRRCASKGAGCSGLSKGHAAVSR